MKSVDGFVQPENLHFRSFLEAFETTSIEKLQELCQKLHPQTPMDLMWFSYFQALIKIKSDQDMNAIVELQKIYDTVKNRFVSVDVDQYRLLGLALKKLGWIYRKNKEFEKAYCFHNIRYQYMQRFGSSTEIHDSLVSLDVDAYSLQDLKLSEFWLLLSCDVAETIQNPMERAKALAISKNNMAGTFSSQKRFPEAVNEVFKSVDLWIDYESLMGPQDNRVVWAYYAVGDIFEAWALHLKGIEQNYKPAQKESGVAFKKSYDLALQRAMPKDEVNSILDRLNKINDLQ